MSNTDRDSMLERWASGMETLEQYYEDLYGPPSTPASLPDVTDINGMLEAIADGLERAQVNINKHSTVYHDKNAAYTKTVPALSVNASIEQLGGRTILWNQICSIVSGDKTSNDVVCVDNGDGSFTVNGTASATTTLVLANLPNPEVGHKCILLGCPAGGSLPSYCLVTRYDTNRDVGNGSIATITNATTSFVAVRVSNGFTADNLVFKPQFFDLTLMFGAGKEPSTVAEFQEMFPALYHSYNAGELISAGVTSVVSNDSDYTTIDTYSVPAEVQALTGYGWSCPNHYNYVDVEAKKYVQEVGTRPYASGDESDNTVITDKTNTYYALTTPVATDISEYLTEDNLIDVEPGGTLTFLNGNDNNYKIPVPSTETFWVGK